MKNEVDWADQWAQFAKGFQNGLAHIDLSPFGSTKTLRLAPGPGFGDLSHPTTLLCLELMAGCVENKTVFDIGCGSGILSLSALFMGARAAYGIDIDPDAVAHASANAALNSLKDRAHFSRFLPEKLGQGVVVINMILTEQQAVLQEMQELPRRAKLWIASGFLISEKNRALSFLTKLGLKIVEEKQSGEWLGLKAI